MISGKLTETFHDPTCVQIIVSQTEQGEQLSMKDKDGTFLVTSPDVRKVSHLPFNQESCSEEEEEFDLALQSTLLHSLFQNLEKEKMALLLELKSTKEEVNQLEAELKCK